MYRPIYTRMDFSIQVDIKCQIQNCCRVETFPLSQPFRL